MWQYDTRFSFNSETLLFLSMSTFTLVYFSALTCLFGFHRIFNVGPLLVNAFVFLHWTFVCIYLAYRPCLGVCSALWRGFDLLVVVVRWGDLAEEKNPTFCPKKPIRLCVCSQLEVLRFSSQPGVNAVIVVWKRTHTQKCSQMFGQQLTADQINIHRKPQS